MCIIKPLYKSCLKPILFKFSPERMHRDFVNIGWFLGSNCITRGLTSLIFNYKNEMLNQTILDIDFENPIGLAAGFDKNLKMTKIIGKVGFGYTEVGSVTAKSYVGNEGKHLWRLVKSESLVVYYGLMNDGVQKLRKRLLGKRSLPIGVSVAKTNCKETVDPVLGVEDYVEGFTVMQPVSDYVTINISCPNAHGGLAFTDPKLLDSLLSKIDKIKNKPVFLKMAPDLSKAELDEVLKVCDKHKVDGLILTNLTKKRNLRKVFDNELEGLDKGGVSGQALKDMSDETLKYVYRKTKGKYVLVGCGGIATAEDAYRKIKLGASLLQLITAMIFEGPTVLKEINSGLAKLLEKDGFKNISEAVGVDNQ
jgi:dihydroorotate dehydrogenase